MTNYKPIKYLSIMWYVFISIISKEIFRHLNINGLLTKVQRDWKNRARQSRKDQLLINKIIKTDFTMDCIDYKKVLLCPLSFLYFKVSW